MFSPKAKEISAGIFIAAAVSAVCIFVLIPLLEMLFSGAVHRIPTDWLANCEIRLVLSTVVVEILAGGLSGFLLAVTIGVFAKRARWTMIILAAVPVVIFYVVLFNFTSDMIYSVDGTLLSQEDLDRANSLLIISTAREVLAFLVGSFLGGWVTRRRNRTAVPEEEIGKEA